MSGRDTIPDTIPTESLDDVEMKQDPEFAKGFKNLSAVPAPVARAITQRVSRLLENKDEFQAYVMRARMMHLLIQDFHARNAPESDDRKKAAETFLKLSDSLTKRPAKR